MDKSEINRGDEGSKKSTKIGSPGIPTSRLVEVTRARIN